MKKFSVTYDVLTTHEAVVKAKNIKEAKKKVAEVIGEPLNITDAWEVKD